MRATARLCLILFGAAALGWSLAYLPIFLQQQKLVAMSSAIERGERYNFVSLMAEANTEVGGEGESPCNAPAVRGRVLVLNAVMDDPAVQENRTLSGTISQRLEASTRALLACSPADSFGWLVLFWLNMTRDGYSPDTDHYLALSYETGPNEAAVALWRNRLVLGLNDRLPSRFLDLAAAEFVKLVDTERFYPEMGEIFAQAPPTLQQRLTEQLGHAQARPREVFAKYLTDHGIKASIPGVKVGRDQSWK